MIGTKPVADLEITKSDDPDPVVVGGQVTYTLTVTNNGPDDAADVRILDQLDPATAFIPGSSPHCFALFADHTKVKCSLGPIPAGDSVQTFFTATVGPVSTSSITNTAKILTNTIDLTFDNNSVEEYTTVDDTD